MIAIKNMKEMPKSCSECPFYFKYRYQPDDQQYVAWYCNLLKKRMECSTYSIRRCDCPLVDMKYELNAHDHSALDYIYEHFCGNVGSYAHNHSVTTYYFTEDAGPYTLHSEITIELCDGSTIKYSIPKD